MLWCRKWMYIFAFIWEHLVYFKWLSSSLCPVCVIYIYAQYFILRTRLLFPSLFLVIFIINTEPFSKEQFKFICFFKSKISTLVCLFLFFLNENPLFSIILVYRYTFVDIFICMRAVFNVNVVMWRWDILKPKNTVKNPPHIYFYHINL